MTYFPLHVHSHFSLQDGLSTPEQISTRCEEIGVEGSAITDHGTMSGHIQFLSEMKKSKEKSAQKALLGCEFYVCKEDAEIQTERNRKLSDLCIIARNKDGWRDMVQMMSRANDKNTFYHKPRLDLDRIAEFTTSGNVMAFSGHVGSCMANILFDEEGEISSQWRIEGCRLARWFENAFGKDNFFLEVQLIDSATFPRHKIIAECIRAISKDTGIPCVATPNSHYARKEDAVDQQILICSKMNSTLQQASKASFGVNGFFRCSQYHIPSFVEMQEFHTAEELDNTLLFASRVDDYKGILKSPILPNFPCPDGMNADSYLRHLCKEGWRNKVQGVVNPAKFQEYGDRVKRELEVLQGAGLSSYFLIVADIINFIRRNKWLAGPGRGSAAGSLVSYLMDITAIDPMPFGLLFERFYNAGRNTADHISMPDVDMDVPKYAREHVLKYMRKKYGEDHVGQMVTFQTIKGRGALTDVLRAHGGISFQEIKMVTKNIVEEHKITDELQKMKQDTGESSILQWCLEHTPKKLDQWCSIGDDGNLIGPLAQRFTQAMRLEGTKTVQSKHPAGVVIAPEPLGNMCPMIFDVESGQKAAAFEMEDLEAVGGLKVDVLSITSLDKVMGVCQGLEFGDIHEISGTICE